MPNLDVAGVGTTSTVLSLWQRLLPPHSVQEPVHSTHPLLHRGKGGHDSQEIIREIEEAGLEASEDIVGEVVGLSDVDVDVGEEGVGESSQKEAEGGEDGEKTDGIGEERVEMEKVLDDLDLSEEGEFQYTDEGLDDGGPENDGFN